MSSGLASPAPGLDAAFAVCAPEPARWDAFCAAHPQGHLLQASPWAALKAAFGWRAERVAVQNAQGELLAGAQLLTRHRYGLAMAYVPRGPLFSFDPRADAALLATLRRRARRQRAVLLRLEPNLLDESPQALALHSWLQLRGLRPAEPLQPRSSVHVDIARPPKELLAAFSKGHRADIRRAERGGVRLREGQDDADLGSFFQIMQETGRRAEFAIHEEAYYRRAWREFQASRHGASALLLAELEGAPVAAFLIFAWGREACYLYSGAREDGLKSGANHLLQWQALQWAQARGCAVYDMWGVPDQFGRMMQAPPEERPALEDQAKSDPLYGVYRFKKGFAGEVVRYLPAYDDVLMPWIYPLLRF